MGFATIVAVYAPVNSINATSDARAPSDAFYDALHSTLSSAPSRDMTISLVISMQELIPDQASGVSSRSLWP